MKPSSDGKGPQVATRVLKDVAPSEIDRDPDNRLIEENDDAFAALVDSVRVFGVLQRLHVRASGERFQLIDGERRCRAAIAAGLEAVPCEVWPARASRGDIVAAGIVLNDQREAHAPIHVARRLRELKNGEGLTSEEIARRLAMPLDRVKTYFSLFGASDFLIQFLSASDVPLKVAVELVRYERATNEARARTLVERFCESPLTREQIVELRRRATESRASGPEEGRHERGEQKGPAVQRAIEKAFRHDPETAVAAIEEALRPLGYLLVAVGGEETSEFPGK
jgi:ParB/RepB/Spo0J family partition protein